MVGTTSPGAITAPATLVLASGAGAALAATGAGAALARAAALWPRPAPGAAGVRGRS